MPVGLGHCAKNAFGILQVPGCAGGAVQAQVKNRQTTHAVVQAASHRRKEVPVRAWMRVHEPPASIALLTVNAHLCDDLGNAHRTVQVLPGAQVRHGFEMMLPVHRQRFIGHGKQAHLQYMPLEGFIAGRKALQLAATTVERTLDRHWSDHLAVGIDQVAGQ
ncbi:hypothetical protein D3C81_1497640 [compost metagenome]